MDASLLECVDTDSLPDLDRIDFHLTLRCAEIRDLLNGIVSTQTTEVDAHTLSSLQQLYSYLIEICMDYEKILLQLTSQCQGGLSLTGRPKKLIHSLINVRWTI